MGPSLAPYINLTFIMVALEVASSHIVSAPHPASKDRYDGVDHLLEGKRHLLVQDFPSASDSLARACKFLANKHGETANECADAYFHYGKTLLELGRMEAGVLGNALKGVPDCDDESYDNIEAAEKMNEDDMEDEEETRHDEDAMETEMSAGEKKNMEDEDPSNLERAWEMLELARSIYSRMASIPTNIRKLCDTLLALGEVSIENENYSQAVEDLNSCLEKRKDKLPNDMREIAETQYQLGVALSYHNQHEEAVRYFNDAIKVLNNMLDTLKADTFNARVGEIDELEKLIPEIREKIQDTIDSKEETSQAKKMRGDSSSGFSSSDMPASSIEPKRK